MICEQCPRKCGAERTQEQGGGVCQMPVLPVLARAALHQWEEPVISGTHGSGTVFFSGCALKCVFCQNEQISYENFGQAVSIQRLRKILQALIDQGAHNINFVNPTHYAHVLEEVLETPLSVPVVYNTGGYDRVETLRRLEGKVDVYLPDLKYLDGETAKRYSAASDYPEVAKAAILEMYRQTGPVVIEDGLIRRGVVIRHLVLPGQVSAAKEVMDWVNGQFRPGQVLFSLMSQYVPWGRAAEHRELNRTLRKGEIRSVNTYMENLGLMGFTQDGVSASSSYIPSFRLEGVRGHA